MEPLVLAVAGIVALGGGVLVLRSFGPGYRVGRLLASAPQVTIEQAESFARAGQARYVRIDGRLDSAEDFPDEHARPLVYRRRRLELGGSRGGWTPIEDDVQVVPFEIREGLAAIAIDGAALGEGLVVLPRESQGTAADALDRVPAGTPPATPLRLRIEQVSAVEHATVIGVPTVRSDGSFVLGPGLGRPLILSTVESAEAMQLLAGGRRVRPAAALALLAVGFALVLVAVVWALLGALGAPAVPAATGGGPAASPGPGGDTRSAGEGPGLVGAPFVAIGLVVLIAAVTVAATLAYVRLTGGPAGDDAGRG